MADTPFRERDGENYAQKWQYIRENPARDNWWSDWRIGLTSDACVRFIGDDVPNGNIGAARQRPPYHDQAGKAAALTTINPPHGHKAWMVTLLSFVLFIPTPCPRYAAKK
jgi:hypothetical protein